MLDDVAKAVGQDYKTRYSKDIWNQLAEHPLDFILDAATLLTLGGASFATIPAKLVVKGGVKGALRAGSLSEKVTRWAGYVPRTPEAVAAAERVYGKASKQVRQGADQGIVQGVRRVGEGRGGELELRQHQNPVLRLRDRGVDKVLGSPALDEVPLVGLEARAARKERRSPAIKADVNRERLVAASTKAFGKLSRDEKAAWWFLHEKASPQEFAAMLKQRRDGGGLSEHETRVLDATLEEVTRPSVLEQVANPSRSLQAALVHSRKLSGDMREFVKRVTNLTDEQLDERRLLTQRKLEGAYPVTEHPTDLQPTTRAEQAARDLSHEELRRSRLRSSTEQDLRRTRSDRGRLAARLRRAAEELLARVHGQDAARAELKRPEANVAVERKLTREEALAEAPGSVRHVPTPGSAPDAADVEQMLVRMRSKVTKGAEWRAARQALRDWLASVYRETRYGTGAPDAEMKRAEMQAVKDARARRKGRKAGPVVDIIDLNRAIDRFGAWDARVAAMAEGAGGAKTRMWKALKEARAADKKRIAQYPDPSLERSLALHGFDPDNPRANPVDDPAIADVVEQYLDQQLEGADLAGVAQGATGSERGGNIDMDQETAQSWLDRARLGDPDLPHDPTLDDVADGIAQTFMPDDRAADIPTQAEFVDRAEQAFMRVFEDGTALHDASTEFGKIRGDAARTLADKLGIRSAEHGIEPTGADWLQAIREKVADAGFDDRYREQVAAVRKSERDFEELGAWAFREDRFVPDPAQVDFGTLLEFVPELDAAAKKALLDRSRSLTNAERSTIRAAAGKLKAAAARAEKRSVQDAVLEQRIARLELPGRREQRLQRRSEELQPVPLARPELVNPATGALHSEEWALLTPEEQAAQLAAAGEYHPHKAAPGDHLRGSGITQRGATAGKPKVQMKASIGARLEQGAFSRDPAMLLREAEHLVRAQHMSDLYDVMAQRGALTPFDRDFYRASGGDRKWMVLDPAGVRGLSRRLAEESATLRELDELLPSEAMQKVVGDVEATTRQVLEAGNTDGLVMVPRSYFDRMLADVRQSGRVAQLMIDRPLDVFRTLVLFVRPAYYVNNLVGQNLILALHEGGPMFVPAYIRFLAHRNLEGARAVFRQAATDEATGLRLWDPVLDKHAAGVRGASPYDTLVTPGGSTSLRARMALSGSRKQRMLAWVMAAPENLNRFGAILTDDLPREFRFMRLMQPHIRAARAAGETGEDAAIAMRLLDADEVLADNVTMQVLDDLIDYRGMSAGERIWIRRAIPFYGWMRGITKWTADLGYNHPEQLMELALASKVGQDVNAQWNQSVPSWLHGAFQVGDAQNGQQRVVNTQGLNPFSTIADLAAITRGLLTEDPSRSLAGGTIAGQINPYLKVALQSTLNKGRDFGSGMPMLTPFQSMNRSGQTTPAQKSFSSMLSRAAGGFLASTPQAMLVTQQRTIADNMRQYGMPSSPTAVYQSPMRDYWYSYLGLPTRNVSLQGAAARLAKDEAVLAGEGSFF